MQTYDGWRKTLTQSSRNKSGILKNATASCVWTEGFSLRLQVDFESQIHWLPSSLADKAIGSLGFLAKFNYDDLAKNMGLLSADHEQGAFVQRDKQERFLGFLAKPKNRRKFTNSLAHFHWFDPRFATPIPWKVDPKLKLWEGHVQGIETIYRLLKSRGAGPKCWAISEDPEIDARELHLRTALEHVNGRQIGTILSCIPGKLAYFESEDETLLLAR